MTSKYIRGKKILSSKIAIWILVAFFVLFNLNWLIEHRNNRILDIDEAGYLGIAIANYLALLQEGLPGWIRSILAPSIQAPMTTALSSLLFVITGPSVITGMLTPLIAGASSVAASYWLARCVMRSNSALLAAALVASCPLIINYSRSFHFAMPATAFMTLCIACMLRTRQFSSPFWSTLFGICLGLLPLARTMAIAFVPGIVVGATSLLVSRRGQWRRRIGFLAMSLLVSIATAAIWLFFNGKLVFEYLFNFGYGIRAEEYGVKQSILSVDAWLTQLQILVDNIYLPHALVLFAGMIAAVSIIVKSLRKQGTMISLKKLIQSPALSLALILVESVIALTSSQNKGSAFIAPIIPLSIILSVWFIQELLENKQALRAGATTGAVICIVASTPLFNPTWRLAHPWNVIIPFTEWQAKITDGRGTFQIYEDNITRLAPIHHNSPDAPYSTKPIRIIRGEEYINMIDYTSNELQKNPLKTNGAILGARHYIYNINSLRLSALLRGRESFPLIQIEPAFTGDTIAGYYNWLTHGQGANACLLLTMSSDSGQFLPKISKSLLLQAAEQAGFTYSKTWFMPDGQKLLLWEREAKSHPCGGLK
jgi:4-amino-4-deoxy-L-arabinose transferase-like glycosyltransferase